jgi:small subunit ribosomal protein S8
LDPISNFLTRIRNGLAARKKEVRAPFSRVKFEIARVLMEEGFIGNFQVEGVGVKKTIIVSLKYNEDGSSVVLGLERVSKQSRRAYVGADALPRVFGGLGTAVVSTSRGIMTDRDARKERVGGEVVCRVW